MQNDRTREQVRTAIQVGGIFLLFAIYFLIAFPEYLPEKMKYVVMAVLSIVFIFVLTCACFDRFCASVVEALLTDRETIGKRAVILLILVLAALTHFDSILHIPGRILSLPINAGNLVVWVIFAGTCLVLLVRVPQTFTPILAVALTWGIVLRIMVLREIPYDPQAADMLSAIEHGCQSLLHGVNPYRETYYLAANHSFPLVYFPLLWLPYLPFKAMAIDIRWFNLLAQVGLFAFVWMLLGRGNRSAIRSAMLVLLALLPDMIVSFFYRQMSHYWFLGAVFLWLVARKRWNLALLAAVGLALMRVTSLTVLWIYLIYVWKQKGMRFAVLQGIGAAAMMVAVFLPFSGVGLARMKYVFFDNFQQNAALLGWQRPLRSLAIGGLFERYGLASLIMPLQVAGLLVIGAAYKLSRSTSFSLFARVAAFAYGYFIWLSDYAYIYYWFMPMMLLLSTYLIETRGSAAIEPFPSATPAIHMRAAGGN